ncbi:unnamed protein product, partial [Closterium sp. NIES-54]
MVSPHLQGHMVLVSPRTFLLLFPISLTPALIPPTNQVQEDCPGKLSAWYRHISRGAWPFSTRDHGWPISDCSSEGLKVSVLIRTASPATPSRFSISAFSSLHSPTVPPPSPPTSPLPFLPPPSHLPHLPLLSPSFLSLSPGRTGAASQRHDRMRSPPPSCHSCCHFLPGSSLFQNPYLPSPLPRSPLPSSSPTCVPSPSPQQNKDGGMATYENTRSYPWLELNLLPFSSRPPPFSASSIVGTPFFPSLVRLTSSTFLALVSLPHHPMQILNPSETYVECTSASIQALTAHTRTTVQMTSRLTPLPAVAPLLMAVLPPSYVECTSASIQALTAFTRAHSDYRADDIEQAIWKARGFLVDIQRDDGSWYGSWGVCFTYGTWFGISGLVAAGARYETSNAVRKAVRFLLDKQLPAGGWGESYLSSQDKVCVRCCASTYKCVPG